MAETYTPIGDPIAMATVLAAGGFPADSYPQGIVSAVNTGAGVYELTLAPNSQVTAANAVLMATIAGLAVTPAAADQANARHIDGDTIEVRTFVAGTLTNRDFDIEIVRRAIGAA